MNQETALSILKTGQNVYLTGSAGTGKTYLLNQYIEYLRVREVALAITASTGIAATHVGGQTIHSWSGIGIRNQVTPKDLEQISKNRQTASRIRAVQVLIIDEISMLSGKVLSGISDIMKHFRSNQAPFGGAQVILSGDFFQLPPVSREALSNRDKFAFMAPIWVQSNLKICYLTQQFRQGRDTLAVVLTEIRSQDVSDDSIDRLREKMEEEAHEESPIKLYTHNADVDAMNIKRLQENKHPAKTFYAETKGKSNLIDSLRQSVLAAPELELKLEARVMFVKNNPERGYYNGTIGVIVDFEDETDFPIVKLEDDRRILAKPEEWNVTDEKETILASYKQIPLRLAWAITVHKSQGMTLEKAEVDLSKTFEAGQGYVALSRLKSWDGLSLTGINPASLRLDALAVKADKRFQELAEESEDWVNSIPPDDREVAYLNFVERCNGTNDPDIIQKNTRREKKHYSKEKKENTYQKTRKMIEDGKGLGEIALERDLSLGTIISHLQQLLKDGHPDLDVSRFRPERKTMEKVEKIVSKLQEQDKEEFLDKEGNVKLSVIYQALNGQLDYETIRLARIFIH